MGNFVEKITQKVIESTLINGEDKDIFSYTLLILCEETITIVSIFIISVFFSTALETSCFLLYLFCIKKRCGGFHANSFLSCYFWTIVIYVVGIIWFIPVVLINEKIMFLLLIVSFVVVEIIGAINHPNINWSKDELVKSKMKSRIVMAIEIFSIICLYVIGINKLIIGYMTYAVIICAFLLILAKIKKQEVLM